MIKPVANLILALIFIFVVVRPLVNRFVLGPREEEERAREAIEGGVSEGEVALKPSLEPVPDVTDELRDLANDYPERAAALIKVWLREKRKEPGERSEGK